MYIEDLIIALTTSRLVTVNPFDSKIVHSFQDQISRGSGLTEKQEALAIKILKRQTSKLNAVLSKDISPFLENPVFRLTRRTVVLTKHINIVPYETYGKAVKLTFPFNESLLNKIREEKSKLNYANWDSDQKSWIFSLDERTLNFISTLINDESFVVDEEFENYKNQIVEIKNNLEQYVPMVKISGETVEFLNVYHKIPQPTNSNIIENLFNARRYGIFTWDEEIENSTEWKNTNQVVKDFLQSDPGQEFSVNLEKNTISNIQEIVKYLNPVLFIIPGGTELEKLQLSLEFLNSIGISKDEISVLFRLPTETGGIFNNYIREQELNSPVTEKTKAVFISSKVPKTILEKQLKFNCVVSFNFYNIHYSIRNLLKWHHNVINVSDKKVTKELNFGNV